MSKIDYSIKARANIKKEVGSLYTRRSLKNFPRQRKIDIINECQENGMSITASRHRISNAVIRSWAKEVNMEYCLPKEQKRHSKEVVKEVVLRALVLRQPRDLLCKEVNLSRSQVQNILYRNRNKFDLNKLKEESRLTGLRKKDENTFISLVDNSNENSIEEQNNISQNFQEVFHIKFGNKSNDKLKVQNEKLTIENKLLKDALCNLIKAYRIE